MVHMAPFGILEAGLGMFCRTASFLFLGPGTNFRTSGPKFGPGISKLGLGWPGRFWDPKWGSEKHGFAWEWFPNWQVWDFPRPKWIVWYPRGIWASWFPPKPSQKSVPPTFPNVVEFGEGPLTPLCIPYWPFVGLSWLGSLWALFGPGPNGYWTKLARGSQNQAQAKIRPKPNARLGPKKAQ